MLSDPVLNHSVPCCPAPDIKIGRGIIAPPQHATKNEGAPFDSLADDIFDGPGLTSTPSGALFDPRAESFAHATEVRFPGQVGPLRERRPCKIKCIGGQWLGPLCATTEDGDKYQPLFKSCKLETWQKNLVMSFRNVTVTSPSWQFPHGAILQARCTLLGLYKLTGDSTIKCLNGEWSNKLPSCVPTNKLTNFSERAPPAILPRLLTGSASFEPSGSLAIYPGSSLSLECLFPRLEGQPEWTWSPQFTHYATSWSMNPDDKDFKYKLTMKDVTSQDSGTFTCTTPRGLTHSLRITVTAVECAQLPSEDPPLTVRIEGNRLGQRATYSCPRGYKLVGLANITCQASGVWSAGTPRCQPVKCPELQLPDARLSLAEYDPGAGGRAVFRCAWGHRINGAPGIECDHDGNWSGPVPTCIAIQCTEPPAPLNGRVEPPVPWSGTREIRSEPQQSNEPTKYDVGSLLRFGCSERHLLVGETSVVCTETGLWSHPPPYCKVQCPYPGDPAWGLLAPLKFSYDPGDTLQVQCRAGHEARGGTSPERPRCLSDGTWSRPVPECTPYEQV
ncbi:locomotion-related protein Hikaru genki-like [Ctenocephalides felis]|uniref:locomotion-related protein Hikaru genki-like n=1 Tax=Ctenocephalides felis TaxID=7515 RepID=UPI000E6E1195|nr:locomotion-related protein Hikaru genki-like [Ctenocephalides felis]